jgi:hypothetical protein
MGLTQNLGRLSPSIFSDASLNIGVGAAPSGSYKFEVTGTSKVSGVLTLGSTLSNGTYTYTLPAATGTLALTSDIPDLSGYVTLATNQTITGLKNFDLGINIKHGIFPLTLGYTGIGAQTNGLIINVTGGGFGVAHQLLFSTTNPPYTYTFPSADGTLALTSNLSSYLPLAGGTLTGALSGTSATFSGTINANSANSQIRIGGATTDAFIGVSTSTLYLTDWATAAKGLTINLSTGAATFSSTVAVTTTGTTAALQVNLPADGNATILSSFGSSSAFGWYLRQDEVTTGDWRIFRRQSNVDYQVLNLSRGTGAATFSGAAYFGLATSATQYVGITENQIYRTGAGDFYVNYSGTGKTIVGSSSGNVLIGTTTDTGEKLQVNGTIKATELRIGTSYTTNYTTTTDWQSSFQTLIPTGVLTGEATYLITIRWYYGGGSFSPYYAFASTIFNAVATNNGTSTGNEVDLLTSTHVNSNAILRVATLFGVNTISGLAIKCVNFASIAGGTIYVSATRIQ